MCRRVLLGLSAVSVVLVACLSAAAIAHGSQERDGVLIMRSVPLRLGCPLPSERVGIFGASFHEVVAVAKRVLYRQITHYQGRSERRGAINTPVAAVVIELGFLNPPRLQGQRELLAQAAKLCGTRVARHSSAVLFDDAL